MEKDRIFSIMNSKVTINYNKPQFNEQDVDALTEILLDKVQLILKDGVPGKLLGLGPEQLMEMREGFTKEIKAYFVDPEITTST
jgi:hypothetical protein